MRVLITGASGGIGAACVQRFLDEGHEVVGFDLLPWAIEHERYRHLIVDVREPGSFPGDLEPQVIVNVAGTQDSADDIAANLCGTINVTERYAFVGEGLVAPVARRHVKSIASSARAREHLMCSLRESGLSEQATSHAAVRPGRTPSKVFQKSC